MSARTEGAATVDAVQLSDDDIYQTASEDGGISREASLDGERSRGSDPPKVERSREADLAPAYLDGLQPLQTTRRAGHGPIAFSSEDGLVVDNSALSTQSSTQKPKPKSRSKAKSRKAPSAFAHDNRFELLEDVDLENLSLEDQTALAPPDPIPDPKPTSESTIHTMMPHEDSSFWAFYGNKLRVNGTIEEVCVIR